jgi:hypothetical protein
LDLCLTSRCVRTGSPPSTDIQSARSTHSSGVACSSCGIHEQGY